MLLCCILLGGVAECRAEPVSGTDNSGVYKDPIMSFIYPPGMSVQEILDAEASTWHWYPWKHIRYEVRRDSNELEEKECVKGNSLDDLPEDLFTRNDDLIAN